MSLVEQARTRLEETRDRIKARIESIGGSGSSSNPEFPTLKEIREKGLLATIRGSSSSPKLLKEVGEKGVLSILEEKFPRVKEIREGGILGRGVSERAGIIPRETVERIRERGILRRETIGSGKGGPTYRQTVERGPMSITDEAAKIEFTDAISIEPS